MADKKQLKVLKENVVEWNHWRENNAYTKIDLSEAKLNIMNLSGAYLIGAYLIGAILSEAYLRGADLSGANLTRAINLTADQLTSAKTLYEAKLLDKIKSSLQKSHPHLFEPPEE